VLVEHAYPSAQRVQEVLPDKDAKPAEHAEAVDATLIQVELEHEKLAVHLHPVFVVIAIPPSKPVGQGRQVVPDM
jgi:hypothetical protein